MAKLNCSLVKTITVDHNNKEKQIRTIIEELRKQQKKKLFRKRKTLKTQKKREKHKREKKSLRGKRKSSKG